MKTRIFILAFALLFIFNFVTPTAILSDGPPPVTQWKGEGTKIKFESIPMVTLQKILNRGSYSKTQTISGTLNFPANAADKNVPVVILLSGSSGISDSQEYWIKILNNIGLATFTVDSNCARRKCRSDKENKSFYHCVVPWSGGKDSTSIASKLKFEYGLNPLLVTFSPLIVKSKSPKLDIEIFA